MIESSPNIRFVTATGADDSIEPKELAYLSNLYPYVEWGILLSKSSEGKCRFPSLRWMQELCSIYQDTPDMNISGHLCGSWVKQLLMGDQEFFIDRAEILPMFNRIQLNVHGIKHNFDESFISGNILEGTILDKKSEFEIIFQGDGVNDKVFETALAAGRHKVSILFDISHGAGILPESWPEQLSNALCGYAGGLSPDNVSEQISKISEMIKDFKKPIWIDAETRLRSTNDQLFDLYKVFKYLENSREWIF